MKRYMRYGEIPPNERSVNFRKLSLSNNSDFTWTMDNYGAKSAYDMVPEKALEAGVSVFELDENDNPVIDSEELKSDLEFRINEKAICYLVTGDRVGTGVDGEPLIKNIKILKKM